MASFNLEFGASFGLKRARQTESTPSVRSRWSDALHVFVLLTFAFSGPLLDRLAHRTDFLVHNSLSALLLLIATLCVALPSGVVLCEWGLAAWRRSACDWLHAALLFCGFMAIAVPIVKGLPQMGLLATIFAAVLSATLATRSYFRSAYCRWFLTLACPGIIIFPSILLLHARACLSETQRVGPSLSKVEVQSPAPVVLVTFDEFCGISLYDAERRIDAARYPNFAALAQEATWYRNATSVHARTRLAVPAILTGKYPPADRAAIAADYPQNLFTLLRATGKYQLTVFEPITRLCPVAPSERHGLWQQYRTLIATLWSVYLYDVLPCQDWSDVVQIPGAWYGAWTGQVGVDRSQRSGAIHYEWDIQRQQQFEHFLDCLAPQRRPTLHFAHVVYPHYPWSSLPSGKRYRPTGSGSSESAMPGVAGPNGESWGNDELAVSQNHQRYMLQVGYVDHLVGRLVARLKETGLYDKCLLIVVADHGVSFRQNLSRRAASKSNLADLMSVPLLIKLPGQRAGEISDRNVETIDVLPTIADVLKLSLPYRPDGQSVLSAAPERPEKLFCDDKVQFREDTVFEAKYTSLQEMLARFGTGSRPNSLFRIGPNVDLIGRSVDQLEATPVSPVKVRLSSPTSFRVDKTSAFVPCYLEGKVDGETASATAPVELAIAVNHRIQAVTRTYALPELKGKWTAMVPEEALHEGDNDVEIYVVSRANDKRSLERCYP